MTSGWFQSLPIRHKLVAMIMVTAITVVILASVGYLITDYYRTRGAVLRDLETQAELVLENAVITIEFLEQNTALEMLRPLGSNPHLRVACLYAPDGSLFVQFPPDAEGRACESMVAGEGHTFHLNRLELVRSHYRNGKPAAYLLTAATRTNKYEAYKGELDALFKSFSMKR